MDEPTYTEAEIRAAFGTRQLITASGLLTALRIRREDEPMPHVFDWREDIMGNYVYRCCDNGQTHPIHATGEPPPSAHSEHCCLSGHPNSPKHRLVEPCSTRCTCNPTESEVAPSKEYNV